MKRWPLILIAAPAAVAVWSGWVGLGQMCGFGPVDLLPGIAHLTVNTAITLPVGVEAYGAYALGAWLAPETAQIAQYSHSGDGRSQGVQTAESRQYRARTFARRSAVGALVLGMAGQVIYHLLAAAGATRAPWPVVVLVSCMPVVTLGFGAALTHLLRDQDHQTAQFARFPESAPEPEPAPVPVTVPSSRFEAAETSLRATVAAGNALSINQLTERFGLSRTQATNLRRSVLSASNGHLSE